VHPVDALAFVTLGPSTIFTMGVSTIYLALTWRSCCGCSGAGGTKSS